MSRATLERQTCWYVLLTVLVLCVLCDPRTAYASSPYQAAGPAQAIAIARSWATAKVPYDQRQTHGGYREDCSGLVSAAWGLSAPGLTTYTLPTVAQPIAKEELASGDVLNNRDGDGNPYDAHVVIFDSWSDSTHTRYNAYEENPHWGGANYTTDIPYPFWPGHSQSYVPMRYNGFADTKSQNPGQGAGKTDWRNATYSMTCDGEIKSGFNVMLSDGAATVLNPEDANRSFSVKYESEAHGDVTGDGQYDTVVLLFCSPQPSNYYLEEVQVFDSYNKLLGELPSPNSIDSSGVLPPQYVPSELTISDGNISAGMMFYGPNDSHASGPSEHRTVVWHWDGQSFTRIS